jgi:hypothetical protein
MPVNGSFAPEAALGGLEIQLPLYPRNRTQLGNRGMYEMCQQRTSATRRLLTQKAAALASEAIRTNERQPRSV